MLKVAAWMAVAIVVLLVDRTDAMACSCARLTAVDRAGVHRELTHTETLAAHVQGTSAIFSGRVIRQTERTTTFQVATVWKGDLSREFTLVTEGMLSPEGSWMRSSCAAYFEVGQEYVVFADGASIDSMSANVCRPYGYLRAESETVTYLDRVLRRRVPSKEPRASRIDPSSRR